jgi:hypothetical protein
MHLRRRHRDPWIPNPLHEQLQHGGSAAHLIADPLAYGYWHPLPDARTFQHRSGCRLRCFHVLLRGARNATGRRAPLIAGGDRLRSDPGQWGPRYGHGTMESPRGAARMLASSR